MQWERLRKLLTHAYQHVPFYRRRMDAAGLRPDEVQSPEAFHCLPILSKAEVQDNLHDLVALNISRESLVCDATGGSTGEPLSFYRDAMASLWIEEACARFRNWIGYTHGDKLALIWGALRDRPSTPPPHERWLNSFDCAPQGIERFIRELVEWQPRAIRAYPSAAAMVSDFVRSRRLPAPRPRAIECSAETLSPENRRLIEDVFDCPVFDMYGSREAPALACECELHSGLHVFSDIRLVEVIREGRPARPGEEGAIVVTDLLNYGMPLIRYEIGDVGSWADGPCACGRGFPRLGEITGRVTNTITTPDGRLVHGAYFTRLFFHEACVKTFQVHQRTLERLDVLVQPRAGFDPERVEALSERIRGHLGPRMHITWSAVDDIPSTPSGKRHIVVSDVPVSFTRPSSVRLSPPRRPRVVFIVDAPGWAHDLKTDNLAQHLARDFAIVKRFQPHVSEADLDGADLVCVYYWLQFGSMPHLNAAFERNRDKLLVGICSHVELEGANRTPGLALINGLSRGAFAISRLLEEEFRPLVSVPLFYTPNGVDTDFYTPGPGRQNDGALRVGWAGSLGNMNPEVRGYHEFIVPACATVPGVELVSAVREEKWRGAVEMREIYRSLDVYLCASRTEGAPNPCLEAAASGVPLLTTRVGNMPQLVRHGENSLFVERDVKDIARKLRLLRDDANVRVRFGRALRRDIDAWRWSRQADRYRRMFNEVMETRSAMALGIRRLARHGDRV